MPADPLLHVAERFAYAVQALAELIPYTVDADLPEAVQVACVENWFTNERVLIEFLLSKPRPKNASARTLLPTWTPGSSPLASALRSELGFVAQHVAHIGLPEPNEVLNQWSPVILRTKAQAVIDLCVAFNQALADAGSPYSDTIHLGISEARRLILAQWQEVPIE